MRASGASEQGSECPSTSGAGSIVESELRKEVTTLREQVLLCARRAAFQLVVQSLQLYMHLLLPAYLLLRAPSCVCISLLPPAP